MEINPTVKDHVTLFLYPFFYKEEKEVIRKRIKSDPLWEIKEPDESERSYFLPRTRELLFQDRYPYKFCRDVLLNPVNGGRSLSLRITQLSLSLLDSEVGILTMGWEVKEDGLQFSGLLDLNESLRFIQPLGDWHHRPAIAGQSMEEYLASFLTPLFGPGGYETIFDERMITFSLVYLNDELPPSSRYKFYNIDSWGMDVPSEEYQQVFLSQHTYRRWQSIGVEYGFTHYSGMGIVSPRQDRSNFNPFWIKNHFTTLYLNIARFLYFQYGILMRIDKDLIEAHALDKERLQEISQHYAVFMKNYWFDRVTDQDQGRELYRLWKNVMEKDYKLWEIVTEKIKILGRW